MSTRINRLQDQLKECLNEEERLQDQIRNSYHDRYLLYAFIASGVLLLSCMSINFYWAYDHIGGICIVCFVILCVSTNVSLRKYLNVVQDTLLPIRQKIAALQCDIHLVELGY